MNSTMKRRTQSWINPLKRQEDTTTLTQPVRITVKSVKSRFEKHEVGSKNVGESKPPVMPLGNVKSGVPSYLKSRKEKSLTAKDVLNSIKTKKEETDKSTAKKLVVSVFAVPVPTQPVVVHPQVGNIDDNVRIIPDAEHEDFILRSSPKKIPEGNPRPMDGNKSETIITNESDIHNGDVDSDIHNGDVDTDNSGELVPSRIPRRVRSQTSIPNSHSSTTDKSSPLDATNESREKIRKVSSDRNNNIESVVNCNLVKDENENNLATKTPLPSSKRKFELNRGMVNTTSTFQDKQKNFINKQGTELEKNTSTYRGSRTPSLLRKVNTPSQQKKAPTPVMPRKNSTSIISKAQPPKSSVGKEPKKNQVSGVKPAKELQQEVSDLQNQLKERTDRINELEITIQNNNSNKLEEVNAFERRCTEFESQLNMRNEKIMEIEGKFTNAQALAKRSCKGFEALGIVLQYYLKKISHTTKQLSDIYEQKTKLEVENTELSSETEGVRSELRELMKKLNAEKHRCETLQNDFEQLAINHKGDIDTLVKKHSSEQSELEIYLKKESENEIHEAKEEFRSQFEQLKEDHQIEINNLNKVHQCQLQEVLQRSENSIKELVTTHESVLSTRESEHEKIIDNLKESYTKQYNELMENLHTTIIEKDKMGKRLKELVEELESDSRIEIALRPYKHVSEELQSLQVVLDLRNDEVKTYRFKNMELQKKVDEYYELKTKFDSVNQENQSIKECLRQRTLSERRLSLERDNLQEKFENELKKVDILAMEKEQLMWRASIPDLSTSLPNVFEDVEDEGCSMSPLRSSGSFSTTPSPKTYGSAKLNRGGMTIPLSKSANEL